MKNTTTTIILRLKFNNQERNTYDYASGYQIDFKIRSNSRLSTDFKDTLDLIYPNRSSLYLPSYYSNYFSQISSKSLNEALSLTLNHPNHSKILTANMKTTTPPEDWNKTPSLLVANYRAIDLSRIENQYYHGLQRQIREVVFNTLRLERLFGSAKDMHMAFLKILFRADRLNQVFNFHFHVDEPYIFLNDLFQD